MLRNTPCGARCLRRRLDRSGGRSGRVRGEAEWNRKTVSTGQENSQDGLGGKQNGTGGSCTGQEDDGTDYEGGRQVRR